MPAVLRSFVVLHVLFSALMFGSSSAFAQAGESVMGATTNLSTRGNGSDWNASYFNFATGDTKNVNRGGGSWYVYQYFSLAYLLNGNERVAFRPAFNTQTAGVCDDRGTTCSTKTRLDDLHLTYSNYSLATLPHEWDLSGTFYLYFPTSESSQEKKWTARLRSWLIFEKVLDRYWTLTYNMKPDYFFNTQKEVRKASSRFSDNSKMAALDHYFELSRYVNRIFTPSFAVGLGHEWYADSIETNSKPALVERLVVQPSTWIRVNRSLKFIAGISNEIEYRGRNAKPIKLAQEEDLTYYVMTFWTI